jgi:hypothetical protein
MPISILSTALSLPVSSPTQSSRKIIHTGDWRDHDASGIITVELPKAMAVMPIELINGCSENNCTVISDNPALTNRIRNHYLSRFGHRDLNGMMNDYCSKNKRMDTITTIIHNVTSYDNHGNNGGVQETHTKLKFHGHDEIRSYYSDIVFKIHDDPSCTFSLESINVDNNQAIVSWSAKTPTLSIVDATDRYVFNSDGLIVKQFFSCKTHEREQIIERGRGRSRSFSRSASESSNDYDGFVVKEEKD